MNNTQKGVAIAVISAVMGTMSIINNNIQGVIFGIVFFAIGIIVLGDEE